MALPGDCFTNPNPRKSLDRSNNKKPHVRSASTSKIPSKIPSKLDIGYTVNAFPKKQASQRVTSSQYSKNKKETMSSRQQAHLAQMVNRERQPKHLDLLEPVSSKERKCLQGLEEYGLLDGGRRRARESDGAKIKPIPETDSSYRQLAYNEYITQAFGLSNENRSEHARQKRLEISRPFTKHGSSMSGSSMDVPLGLSAKAKRPKIQVTIPGKRPVRPASFAQSPHICSAIKERAFKRTETPSSISPPSTITRGMTPEFAQARLSIVSPLSVVEMPKPRRPFSANSFETMSMALPKSAPLLSKAHSTDSSDDTSGQDDRSSNYSPTSSMSSLTSDSGLLKAAEDRRISLAFSVMSPTAAGVFDQPRRGVKGSKSFASFADKAHRNKPLPPEPGLGRITPLSISRSSSLKRRQAPAPLNVSRQSSMLLPSRRISRASSLRSKYTPADLDALDDAFLKTSPRAFADDLYAHVPSPTLSQAEQALEAHLDTIDEDSAFGCEVVQVPLLHDPLQIRRGPMHMEPSRRAPPPPASSQYIAEAGAKKQTRPPKRAPSHVALQMIGSKDETLRRRISIVGSSVKASRILGQTTAVPMERGGSLESNWSSSESPHYSSDSSDLARDDSHTPESDVSSVPDAAFEEIRTRLELLSPKVDATEAFHAFRDRHGSGAYSVKLPLQQHSNGHSPHTSSPNTSTKETFDIPEVPPVPQEYRSETLSGSAIGKAHFSPRLEQPAASASSEDSNGLLDERLGHHDHVLGRPRSLGSIAMSEIPDMYASLPSPAPTIQAPLTQDEVERMISADAAEKVLLRILENLDNLQDLFATATVSRGFYRTFKRHELSLMKNALYGMSPAAWELREMSNPYPGLEGDGKSPRLGYTPSLYLQHYMRDMYTMIALKSMILIHCESFLRTDTITALAGGETERASQIDDAFWRVWTFCRVFGCGTNREDDIVGQMDWLRGGVSAKQHRRTMSRAGVTEMDASSIVYSAQVEFGQGNAGGLTAEELYDMTEIWTCLGVLVRGFQGKRDLARGVGIFESADVTSGDAEQEDAALEEWTYHLLTLAPPAVLDVTSPNSPTATTFAHAQARGYTVWTPPSHGASRSTFLKEAVSRVYEERMVQRHPTVSISPTYSPVSKPDPSSPTTPSEALASRQRCAVHKATIQAKRNDPSFKALPPSEERPMSNYPDVLLRLDGTYPDDNYPDTPTVPDMPLMPMGLPTPAATPTLPKVHLTIPASPFRKPVAPSPHLQTPAISLPSNIPTGPQVRDPVDVAVDRLVAMGFEERKAKKALADTDSGNSVDFDRAVEVLVRDRKRDVGNLMHGSYRGRKADAEGASPNGLGLIGASARLSFPSERALASAVSTSDKSLVTQDSLVPHGPWPTEVFIESVCAFELPIMTPQEDLDYTRQGLLKENSIPLRPSVDQAFRSPRSSAESEDEFNELHFDQDHPTKFRNGRKWPWVAKFRRIISGEGPSYEGQRRPVQRPSRTSRIRACCWRKRICLIVTGILLIGLIVLLSGSALWVYKTAPEDGQSPPWYPSPQGGTVSKWEKSYQKAAAMVERMTLLDKVNVTSGTGWSQDLCVGNTAPANTVGFPALCLQDGPLGLRFLDHSSAFPAGVTVGATWNKELMYQRGKAHGTEAKGKGVNVLLGPAMGPFGRMPAGGRNWEGFGPDPVIQGVAAAQTIKGIQDVGVMATAKHYIANEQEHFRQAFEWGLPNAISSNIDDRTLHELYLWPFAESVRAGVASVMCSYNMLNNSYACGNSKLMNGILKDELGFQGFVQSDWLAQRSGVASALAGLDMTMPGDGLRWMDGKSLFGSDLTKAVLNSSVPLERMNDMATRVVAAWYQLGQDNTTSWPPPPPNGTGGPNFSSWTHDKIGRIHQGSDDPTTAVVNQFVNVQDSHNKIARKVAAEGTILVKNEKNILPLSRKGGEPSPPNKKYRIGIYGSDAALNPNGMNVCPDRSCNGGTLASGWGSGAVEFPYIIAPVDALTASFSNKTVALTSTPINTVPTRTSPLDPSAKPENQDLCLVFAGSISGEGFESWDGIRGDRNDLHLDNNGDALISNLADSCAGPVIAIIHAVGPVVLDTWIEHSNIHGVLLANLPGQESGNALADVLFGDVDASGRLPYTVGKTLEDYGPGGQVLYYPNGVIPQQDFTEGLLVDYRYFDAKNITPRYPFGYGLSYTTFSFTNLTLKSLAERSALPAPRPEGLTPPAYSTDIPNPKEALFPKGFRKLKGRVYPYIKSIREIRKGKYPYPKGYDVPQNASQAGGGQGGNPDLFTPMLALHVAVKNTGDRKGQAVVQVYVGMPGGVVDASTGQAIEFPPNMLRAFEKVELGEGEEKVVRMNLTRKDLSYWSTGVQNWVIPDGDVTVRVGASSRDLGLSQVWSS